MADNRSTSKSSSHSKSSSRPSKKDTSSSTSSKKVSVVSVPPSSTFSGVQRSVSAHPVSTVSVATPDGRSRNVVLDTSFRPSPSTCTVNLLDMQRSALATATASSYASRACESSFLSPSGRVARALRPIAEARTTASPPGVACTTGPVTERGYGPPVPLPPALVEAGVSLAHSGGETSGLRGEAPPSGGWREALAAMRQEFATS